MHQNISQPLQPGQSGPRNMLMIIASQPTNSGIEHLSAGGGDGEGAWEVLEVVLVVVVMTVVVVVVVVAVVGAVVGETGGSVVETGGHGHVSKSGASLGPLTHPSQCSLLPH